MKKGVLFLIFGAIALVAAGYFLFSVGSKSGGSAPVPSDSPTPTAAGVQNEDNGGDVLTASEVAKHNAKEDCWFIMNDKVYDFTAYFGKHPGGDDLILESCGTDATETFKELYKHSDRAAQMHEDYFIGNIGEARVK